LTTVAVASRIAVGEGGGAVGGTGVLVGAMVAVVSGFTVGGAGVSVIGCSILATTINVGIAVTAGGSVWHATTNKHTINKKYFFISFRVASHYENEKRKT
jgi:hypothetical protein